MYLKEEYVPNHNNIQYNIGHGLRVIEYSGGTIHIEYPHSDARCFMQENKRGTLYMPPSFKIDFIDGSLKKVHKGIYISKPYQNYIFFLKEEYQKIALRNVL